jgi:hypothetical protein
MAFLAGGSPGMMSRQSTANAVAPPHRDNIARDNIVIVR